MIIEKGALNIMIPKIIHYCWLSDDPVPDNLKKCMESWKKLEGYEIKKWDFSRFDKSSSVWVKEAFDNRKYAFAADFIRLYALYTEGGIYLDMDIEVLKPFDDLLHRPYFLAYESPAETAVEAACMGFTKGNEYLKKCLDYYKERHFVKNNGEFDTLPLPQIMNHVASENAVHLECFDWQTFTCKSFDTGIEYVSAKSYTIHHFAGSWLDSELQNEIEFRHRLNAKYKNCGDILFKLYKYGLHPWKICGVIKTKLKMIR